MRIDALNTKWFLTANHRSVCSRQRITACEMLSMLLTFDPMTLKISSVSCRPDKK